MTNYPKLTEQGFIVLPRDLFLSGMGPVQPFEGATSMTDDEIREAHAEVGADLRKRASQYVGSFVIYDPWADSEGWMLVGDMPHILDETERMLDDMDGDQ